MAEWRNPVTNRSMVDVNAVDPSVLEYQKGALNIDDLNRIEGNQFFIVELLKFDALMIPYKSRNYREVTTAADGSETVKVYTDWQEHHIPWYSEIMRIRENYNYMVRLFLVGLGLPIYDQNNYLMYSEVNDWEKAALLSRKMFEEMEKEYIPCGTMDSGGDRLL